MYRVQQPWTEEEKQKAIELFKSGVSASKVGKVFGRSRNSIIGMVFRAGHSAKRPPTMDRPPRLPPKPKPQKTVSLAPVKKPSPVAAVIKMKAPIPEPAGEGRIKFPSWTNSRCKYIIGEVRGVDTIACGEPSISHKHPWCAYHTRIVYNPRGQ